MTNLIDITDLADSELDALLSGTFGATDVETGAGADAFLARAQQLTTGSWLAGFQREVLAARAQVTETPLPWCCVRIDEEAAVIEDRILARQEADSSRWT